MVKSFVSKSKTRTREHSAYQRTKVPRYGITTSGYLPPTTKNRESAVRTRGLAPLCFSSLMSLFQANEKWTSLFSKISRTTSAAAAAPLPTSSPPSSSWWKKFHRACRKWAFVVGSQSCGKKIRRNNFATSGQSSLLSTPLKAAVWYEIIFW